MPYEVRLDVISYANHTRNVHVPFNPVVAGGVGRLGNDSQLNDQVFSAVSGRDDLEGFVVDGAVAIFHVFAD
jgi:hypothetical protein